MKKAVYMDYAAATPVDAAVIRAMTPYFADKFFNPSALYLVAKSTKQDLEHAREQVAQTIGARPGEVIFTAGGTEANNLAIFGVAKQFPGHIVIISAVEHESVREAAQCAEVQEAPVDKKGIVITAKLKTLIDDETVLVSVLQANNEVGSIQPIKEIAQIVAVERKKRQQQGNKTPIYLHTDACQASNYLDIHVSRLGVDMMTLNGGKIYGPKQSGVLYVRAGVRLQPLIVGGGQEFGLRSGTENVANEVGFASALLLARKKQFAETKRVVALRELFFDLVGQKIPQATINGSLKQRLPNNVHLTIPGFDNERLLMELDERAIMCATGSACSASKDEPSHVLKSMGLSDEDAQSSLRFTMGRGTTEDDVRYVVETLQKLVAK